MPGIYKNLLFFSICGLLWLHAAEVDVFYTTDLHGCADAFAALAPQLKSSNPNVRIDCGDTIWGTLQSGHSKGKLMMALLNAAKYDVWVPGNHDLEYPPEILRDASFRGAILGAEWTAAGVENRAWVMLRRGIWKIAVIGMTDPAMPRRLLRQSPYRFSDQKTALRRALNEVLRERPDLIVLAWHAGIYSPPGSMFRFLREFPEIDLILAGHSHEENPGRLIGRAYLVQAGAHGRCAAKITAHFNDKTRKLEKITSELLRPASSVPPEWNALIAPYQAPYLEFRRQMVAECNPPLSLPGRKEYSNALLKITAEAVRTAGKTHAGLISMQWSDHPIPYGIIHQSELFLLLGYENMLYTMTLTAPEFRALLEEQLEKKHARRHAFAVSAPGVEIAANGTLRVGKIPDPVTITASDYLIARQSRILRAIAENPERMPPRPLLIPERQALEQFLKTNQVVSK